MRPILIAFLAVASMAQEGAPPKQALNLMGAQDTFLIPEPAPKTVAIPRSFAADLQTLGGESALLQAQTRIVQLETQVLELKICAALGVKPEEVCKVNWNTLSVEVPEVEPDKKQKP